MNVASKICPDCGDLWADDIEVEAPEKLAEIADLMAEAARTSPHAKQAYDLLRDAFPDTLEVLSARQFIIAGRMRGLPL